jgi:rhodanese-related sulfurtransferase
MLRLSVALSLGLLLPALAPAQEPAPKWKVLKAPDLEKLLAEPEKYLFLDVRRPDEISKLGTVKGFRNVAVEQLADRIAEVPKDKPVVTLCNRARRAATAAGILEEKGYTIVAVGGLEDIKKEEGGSKLITEFPPAPAETEKK